MNKVQIRSRSMPKQKIKDMTDHSKLIDRLRSLYKNRWDSEPLSVLFSTANEAADALLEQTGEIERVTKQRDANAKRLDTLPQQCEELRAERDTLAKQFVDMKTYADARDIRIGEQAGEIKHLQGIVHAISTDIIAANAERDTLRAELFLAKSEAIALENDLEMVQTENDELSKSLKIWKG